MLEGIYIKPAQLHLTLTFLGKVDTQHKQLVQKALRVIQYQQFEGYLGTLGIFSNQQNVHIVWIDFNTVMLKGLVQQITNVLKPIVKLEEREFVSHITLVRIKKVQNTKAFEQQLSILQHSEARCKITEFVLKKSELTSKGSIYYDVEHYLLTS